MHDEWRPSFQSSIRSRRGHSRALPAMGNSTSGTVVTGEDLAMEETGEVIPTNSDIEDNDSSSPEEPIPCWVRWTTLAMPVIVKSNLEDKTNGIGDRPAMALFSKMLPGTAKEAEESLKQVTTPQIMTISGERQSHPRKITEADINSFAATPGSAQVMEANFLLAERVIAESGANTSDRSVVWRMAIAGTIAAYCGMAKAPVVTNSETFRKVWSPHLKCKVNGKFNKTKAIKKMSPTLVVEAYQSSQCVLQTFCSFSFTQTSTKDRSIYLENPIRI